MRLALLLVIPGLCAAETSVAPPLIGVVRDCAGKQHRVYGVAGAFVVERESGTEDRFVSSARPHRPPQLPTKLKLPGPARELEQIGPDWLAAWPYLIRLTRNGAEIHRLPGRGCGGRP